MISCKKATLLIVKQEERSLSLRERVQLRIHLQACDLCRHFKSQMQWLSRLFRSAPEREEERLSKEKKQAIKRLLKEE